MTAPEAAGLRESILGLHRAEKYVDYVATPPIVEDVCLECPVGDGYQQWPCATASLALATVPPQPDRAELDVERLRRALIAEQRPQRVRPLSVAPLDPVGTYRHWAERIAAEYARLSDTEGREP